MPYLSFRLDPSGDASNLDIKVSVNGEEIFSWTISGGVPRRMNELFPGSFIRKGEENDIKFEITGGLGSVTVSDVIMWFIRSGWYQVGLLLRVGSGRGPA